jgi:glutathione S-transferase
MGNPVPAVHERMAAAYEFYLAGIENALAQSAYLTGDALTIADISFVCDFAQFLREGHYSEALSSAGLSLISEDGPTRYPRAFEHMLRLSETAAFARHMGTYLDWYRQRS